MTEPPLLVRHLGCGDGLMLAGGAVELAREFGCILFPAWHGHMATFQELFKDHPEVAVLSVTDERDMFAKQRLMILTGTYKVARDYWRTEGGEQAWRQSEPFDQMVYREIGVPLEKKWDSFPWKFQPDQERLLDDETIYLPYIFVHDDSSRGYVMNMSRIGDWQQSAMFVTSTGEDLVPITNYANSIYYSTEIHAINSAFLWFADLLPLRPEQPKFFHRYARPWNVCDNPTLRQNWTILD